MALVIEDPQIEHLAQQIARAEGVSLTEVVRAGLLSLAEQRGVLARQPRLRQRLATLARELDAVPPPQRPDRRSDSEILDYNEHGVW